MAAESRAMTEEEIEAIAEKVAEKVAEKESKKTVKDNFLLMGVNVGEDKALLEMQKDFMYLREARLGKEEFISKSKWAVMGVFIAGALGLLAKGFSAGLLTWLQPGSN